MKRILIVDDDEAILESLSMVLEENYEVMVARDGAEALLVLDRAGRFDVVLLDLMMPVLDGAGVMKELHARGSSVPVIIASAATRLRDRSAELGATDYIAKPFDLAALEAKIEQATGGGGGDPPASPQGTGQDAGPARPPRPGQKARAWGTIPGIRAPAFPPGGGGAPRALPARQTAW